MLASIDAAMVGVLKQPCLEGSAIRIELIHGFENVQEDPLDGLFRFSVIAQDCSGDLEDQRTMPIK